MGIGNGEDLSLSPQTPQLITPHGDREPGVDFEVLFEFQSHYPSWGSGTLASPAASQ